MSIDFSDRVVLVTGAGGGIGRAHALLLAQRGATVIVNDVGLSVHGDGASSGAAEAVVAEIEAAGGRALASTESIASPEGGEAIVAAAVAAYGRLDVVIHNAGILRDK
ncbi:MAG TPA: SDR family NAD(P)-dependent oxidoreductase [Conexibacter sp.]|nr:SDR family NAD(P)-dependent oxidoreductase [Conexibacter sp.]